MQGTKFIGLFVNLAQIFFLMNSRGLGVFTRTQANTLSASPTGLHPPPKTSLVAQMVKNLPAVQETRYPSLGWEDLLEKEMATYSSILAWKIPWTEEPIRLQSMGLLRVRQD